MIRVMVVEDEPAAMSYITSLIQSKCSGVETACRAEDGREAMDLLACTQVDIVITDIQMTGVNGIELARWIRRMKPDILTLFVSGFSDFEYAKGAIQAGVVEYLLKPIRPAELTAAMEKLIATAKKIRRAKREKWLSRVFTGGAKSDDAFDLWPNGCLLAGVIRRGILPNMPYLSSERFDYPAGLPEDLAAVYIHDESEIGFALPLMNDGGMTANSLAAILSGSAPYYTALIEPIAPGECRADLFLLPMAARKAAVPGLSQTIAYTETILQEQEPSGAESALITRLCYAISDYQPDQIKEGAEALFALWEKENRHLVSVERALTRVFQLLAEHAPQGYDTDALKRNTIDDVRDICRCAEGFPDMLRLTLDYFEKMFWSLEHRGKRGELARQIEAYIRSHLGEPLSTQQICAAFGISQSYLSQLFRKYVNRSFIEYITERRIEEAKRMMCEFPDMPIKDIAARLGFSDPFYFSKVFRSLTGVPPSEYRGSV